MSAPSAVGELPAPVAAPTPPRRSRGWVWPVAIGVLVVLVLLLTAWLTPRTKAGDLDPESAQPRGSRAVAQILRAQGVDVRVARRSADALAAARAGTTVVLVRPELAPTDTLTRLASSDADLVVVQPDAVALTFLDLDVQTAGDGGTAVRDPGCDQRDAVAAGRATAGGQTYRLLDTAQQPGTAAAVCYRDPQDQGAGSVVVLTSGQGQGGRRDVVLGQADVLRNRTLADEGNAALALRLLGARPQLTWYLPDPLELAQTDEPPTLSEQIPSGLRWAVLQLVVALVAVMLWRGRRLGRLVTEPLPVVVRSAETQEGRARLYRQANARGRAAATLRTAALRRLARRLDVPPDGSPGDVVARAAAVTGRDPAQVHAVLLGPAPGTDADLVALADAMDSIEQDV